MSTDKVDAREAYLAEAKRLAQLHACEKALESLKSDDAPDSEKTLHTLMEHLRTQPEGYVLVPVEPTDAMARAALSEALKNSVQINGCNYYRVMIAAAQEGK